MSDQPTLPTEDQITDLIEKLVDLLDPLLGPDLSVGTRVEDGDLVVEITAVLNGGPDQGRCPECNGRKVVTDPWTGAEDRCPSCTEQYGGTTPGGDS